MAVISSFKLKNLIILILLLTNIFLLFILVPRELSVSDSGDRLAEGVAELFSGQGIRLDPSVLPDSEDLGELELEYSPEVELSFASRLLGNIFLIEDGSSVVATYIGDNGSAEFRSSGELSFSFSPALEISVPEAEYPGELLGSLGFSVWGDPELTLTEDGDIVVSVMQSLRGVPVYSSGLDFSFEDGRLSSVSGVWYISAAAGTGGGSVSAASALHAFLNSQDSLGWLCSSVTSVEQGWVEAESASLGTTRLLPVWRIGTDTGVFQVDALNCTVTAL